MAIVTMRQLLEAGIHFGHQTRRWNPKMQRFIFGQRNGIYIIDLQKTLRQLTKAYLCVRDRVADGGHVLFVGTKKQAQEGVAREAQRCGMYYVNNRWLGGALTNWETIRQSIRKLEQLEEADVSGKLEEQFTKKEAGKKRKQGAKLEKNLRGIRKMPGLPSVMFVIDAKKEAIAVREAARCGIPCIGIVDTNCDPDVVPIPVPGNDDAIRAVNLFCSVIADAVMDGRMKADKMLADQDEAPKARRKEDRAVSEPVYAPAAVETENAGADLNAEE
jgi:small subunit ribosomal protein S2